MSPASDDTTASISGALSGYYRLSKTSHMDEYLKAQRWPWAMRKCANKYGERATDIVRENGRGTLTVVSLNAKGVWSRKYTVGKELLQPNAAGSMCKTTTWLEGHVHKSRMVSKNGDTWESWRYVEGGVMVVKSIFTDAATSSQGHMYWYFEEVRVPGGSLSTDQSRAVRVAGSDTARLQRLAAQQGKWETPADHLIARAGSDSPRKGVWSGATSPLSNISPTGSGMLSTMPPSARQHSGVAPGAPPPSESSQARASQDPQPDAAVSDAASEAGASQRPERGMLMSPSSESINALAKAENDRSGSVSLGNAKAGGGNSETLLSFLVSEFGDGRSIAAVVPLQARLAALEPELLGLSPEQAEETQLKQAELEGQVQQATMGRAGHAAGWRCCGLFTCVLHRYILPDHLRAWDL